VIREVGRPFRRAAAVFLCILLMLGQMPVAAFAEEASAQTKGTSPLGRYNDLPDQAFYLEALAFLTAIGAIAPNEDGGFAPDEPVTRTDFAVWTARSLGLSPVQGTAFTDVSASSAEAPYIHALHRAGFVRGYGDGTFRGDRTITRAEAAVMLAGIAGRPAAPGHAAVFADVRADDWFAGAVGALANLRVASGKTKNTFAPGDTLTRGEAAALLYRLLFEVRRIEALDGESVTIGGHRYRWDDALAGLFWEGNRDALIGSAVWFENEGDVITAVTGLELAGAGAEPGMPVFFDGGGAVIAGSLYVSADNAAVTNLRVTGNLVITAASREAVLLADSSVDGLTVVAPVLADLDDPPYNFLYFRTAFTGGVFLSRHVAVVDLTDLVVQGLKDAAARMAKADRPVSIAELGENEFISVMSEFLERRYGISLKQSPFFNVSPPPVMDMLFDPGQFLLNFEFREPTIFDLTDQILRIRGLSTPNFAVNSNPAGFDELLEALQAGEITAGEFLLMTGITDSDLFSFMKQDSIGMNGNGNDAAEEAQGRDGNGPGNAGEDDAEEASPEGDGDGTRESGRDDAGDEDGVPDRNDAEAGTADGVPNNTPNNTRDDMMFNKPARMFTPLGDASTTLVDVEKLLAKLDALNLDHDVPDLNLPVMPSMQNILDNLTGNASGTDGTTGSSDPSGQTTIRVVFNFMGAFVLKVAGNSVLDFVPSAKSENKVIINGDADRLEIRIVDAGQKGPIEIEVNGHAGKVVVTGDFSGEIVFTGTGQIGEIETDGEAESEPTVRLEGDLDVETLNGRPVAMPPVSVPSSPSSSPRNYNPTVTQAVYDAHTDHADFVIHASDAANVYYAAWEAELGGPADAETLREWVASADDSMANIGKANVTGGAAVFTVNGLKPSADYVLYAVAEAPNGKLSEVYEQSFDTRLRIIDATYNVLAGNIGQFRVRLNTSSPAMVYYVLAKDPDAEYDANAILAAFGSISCYDELGEYCGGALNMDGNHENVNPVVIEIEYVPGGSYNLFLIAERQGDDPSVSPVFKLPVEIP